jgi:cell division septal protein FtsQ
MIRTIIIFFIISLLVIGVTRFKWAEPIAIQFWPLLFISINDDSLQQVNIKEIAQCIKNQKYKHLWGINLDTLRTEINKILWIKDVMIQRKWPSTLIITVQENVALAIVNDSILIDTGHLMNHYKKYSLKKLPKIDLNTHFFSKIELLLEQKSDKKGFYFQNNDYLAIIKEYKKMEQILRNHHITLKTLMIDRNQSWTLSSFEHLTIKLGQHHRLKRIKQLNTLLPLIRNKKSMNTIDLRYKNGIAVKFKKTCQGCQRIMNTRL